MGSICSTSEAQLNLMSQRSQKERELANLKSVKIAARNFVTENLGNFYDIYSLVHPPLGAGAWGEVRKCTHKTSLETRVVKMIKKAEMPEEFIKSRTAFNEAMILKKLDHPNLPRIFEFFEDEIHYYIVMEYLKGGDLFDRIIESKKFSEKQIKYIMKQLFLAVNYLHSKGIVHRDIKPENIMMVDKQSLDIKLTDFDTATLYRGTSFRKMLGTPLYMAPEIVKGRYNEKCDLWSCGIILYILLRGYPPYDGNDESIIEILKNVEINFDEPYWNTVPPAALDLLKSLVDPSRKNRISAEEACSHEWFNNLEADEVNDMDFLSVLENIKQFKEESKLKSAIQTFIISKIVDPSMYKKEMAIFHLFDKNKDGEVSIQEIENILLQKGLPLEEVKMYSEFILQNADTDKSGFIDYTEFIRASMNKNKYLTRENIVKAFMLFDQDRSGAIEVEEIKYWLGENRVATKSLIEELLQPIDDDKDGKINLEEFENFMIQDVRRKSTYFKEGVKLIKKKSGN